MAKKEEVKEKEIVEEKAENIVNNAANDSETPNDNGTTEEEAKEKSAEELLQDQIEELNNKNAEINDKYIRLSAEFDNYRRRTLKEKGELIKTAGGDAIADILPIVDDFERGLDAMDKAEDVAAVKEGVSLIYNKFKEFIKNKGITEIEAHHQDFDTDFHEALTKIPAPEEGLKGKVIDVVQKGYKIDEKVIRFAKVVVGE